MKKKVLIAAGAVLALVVGVVVVAFIAVDPQRLVEQKKDELLKDVSQKIGREVTAGKVTAKVGSQLFARIEQLQVAGAPGKQPQAQIGYVDVRFSLLRALLTFGRDLHVERFTVNQLVLRAARDAEGRWDFQDILDKTAGDPAAEPEKKKDTSFLAGARIARMSIVDGRVEIDDKILGRPLVASDVDIDVSDVVLGDPLHVTLHAILEDGGRKSPVDVAAKLARLPKDLDFDVLPDLEVVAKLQDVDAGPWGGLAPGDVPAPVAGTVRTDLTLKLTDDKNKARVDGVVFLRGFTLRDAVGAVATQSERLSAPKGTPLDADISIALERDAQRERLVVEKLTLAGGGLDVKASLVSVGSGIAGLEKADVNAAVQDIGRVMNVLPPSLRALPPEVRIEGPLSAKVAASGAEVDLQVNLDAARVRYLDVEEGKTAAEATSSLFDKANGKPLNLTLHGTRKSGALDVDRFALVVDNAKLAGTMSLPTGSDAPLVADVNSGPVQLASLQGLVPPFKDAIGRGQRVDGVVEVKLQAKSDGGKQNADAAIDLKALDINLAATTVRGAGSVSVKAAPQGGDVDLQVVANLDGISIVKKAADGSTQLNKPSGTPLRLDVTAKKQKARADVSKLALAIGKSTVNGKGSVSNLDQKVAKLDIDLGSVALGFDDLRAAIPGASKLPAGGRLTGNVKLAGGTSADTLAVDANNLSINFGSSKVAGDVSVKNLSKPVLDVKLPTIDLAFDDLRSLQGVAGDLPAGGRYRGSVTMAGDTAKSSTVKVKAKIDSLFASGSTMRGNVEIDNLDKPRFDLNIDADNLDVDKLRETFGTKKEGADSGKKRDNPHGLSKETRELLANVNGKGVLKANKAIVKSVPMTNFKGDLVMTRGVLRFDTLEFGLYGGTMTATGSTLDLPSERTGYDLKLKGKDIDVGAAVADQTNLGRIFTGRVSPDVKVKGRGIAPGDFAISAEGPAEMSFKSLSIATLDLLGPISDAFNATGKVPGMKMQAASTEKGLSLEGFTAIGKLLGGRLKLDKPIEANSPMGKVQFEGAAGLDAGPDLRTTLQLTPQMIAKMTGNKVQLKEPVPVPMRIGGTWDKPKVTGVDVAKLVTSIASALGKDAVNSAVDRALGTDKKDDKKSNKSAQDKAADAAKRLLGGKK